VCVFPVVFSAMPFYGPDGASMPRFWENECKRVPKTHLKSRKIQLRELRSLTQNQVVLLVFV